jgi:hypothetical protein
MAEHEANRTAFARLQIEETGHIGQGTRRARRRCAAAARCEGGFRGGRARPSRWCVSAPPDLILQPP